MRNYLGEREYQTWAGWKKAAKEAGAVRLEGDKDIANAFAADGFGVGEWDGEKGTIYIREVRSNPSRGSSIRMGDQVIGIMGVDGGYAGVVTGVSRDSRGRTLVSYVDDNGNERVTFDFNLSKNVPARGEFPRHNPSRRRSSVSDV